MTGTEKGNNLINLLLMEDNLDHVEIIWNALTEMKDLYVNFEYVDRLEKGLNRLARGGIDVVLLSLRLPDNTKVNPFLKIKDRLPDVPVIVLTSLKNDKTAIEAMLAGAENYLIKGLINSDLLRRAIHDAIRRERTEKALVSH